MAEPPPEPTEPPVWRRRWFQWSIGVIVVMAALAYILPPVFKLLYATRTVLVPVLVGLALAYIVNPMVTWIHRKWKVPRQVLAGTILLLVAVVAVGLTGLLDSPARV